MALVGEQPNVYFNFPGISDCGLILPAGSKFPTGAYSICTWLRVESLHHPHISPYTPYIFRFVQVEFKLNDDNYSLLTQEGYGIEIFISEGVLCLKIEMYFQLE